MRLKCHTRSNFSNNVALPQRCLPQHHPPTNCLYNTNFTPQFLRAPPPRKSQENPILPHGAELCPY